MLGQVITPRNHGGKLAEPAFEVGEPARELLPQEAVLRDLAGVLPDVAGMLSHPEGQVRDLAGVVADLAGVLRDLVGMVDRPRSRGLEARTRAPHLALVVRDHAREVGNPARVLPDYARAQEEAKPAAGDPPRT